jgi:hypothetical protein
MLDDIKLSLEFIFAKERKSHAFDVKFEVFLGSVYYSLKIMHEIMTKGIDSAILGRHGIRTLVEVYVMMKYLIIKEPEKPNIWNQYKQYGIGKYKLVLKRQQEKRSNVTHLNEKLLEIFVNEDKSEEFVDIDVTYFDKLSIKDKFHFVDEIELYEICYEYDTNYSHGLWGAVRESSMTFCDNALHFNHKIPDQDLEVELPSVVEDCKLVFFKLLLLFSKNYTLPDWFVKKYKVYLNEKS